MASIISIEIPDNSEALVRRFVAMIEELNNLASSAPDGTVFDACEAAVVEKGRDLNKQVLADTVARRVETAEKRGHRFESVRAVGPKKTAVPRADNS
jgi:hypothetical protein